MSNKVLLLAVCAFVIISNALSVFCADTPVILESVVITSSRYEQPIKKLPASVSVVTREDIRMSNYKQTTDILGELPGVFIRKTGDFGRADVDIRGIGGNGRQLGIFIDGRPDKMGVFGCSVTHTLPMNNVERIEVIRGPESVLYGSDAFGGVVNIITRRAAQKLEGGLLVSGGTYNTRNILFQQGSKLGAFDYYMSVNRRQSDGNTLNSSYQATDYSGLVGYAISKNSDISFSGKYFTGIKKEPIPSAAGTWNDYDRGSADITYKKTIGSFDGSLKAYRSFGEHNFSDGFHSKDYTNGFMFHGKIQVTDQNVLTSGADSRYQFGDILNTMPRSLIKKFHKYEYGVYVNDDHTFFEQLTFTGGARYNYDELAEEIVNPKAGVVFDTLHGTILRVIWSKGFRAPQINDLYLWGGNKDLKPEKVTNYEAGIRQNFGKSVDMDVAVYEMEGKDIIQLRNGKNVNIGDFTFKGVETSLTAKLADSLSAQANCTYFNPDTQTTGRPGSKIGVSVKFSRGAINAILSGDHVGKYYADDYSRNKIASYTILNTKVDYRMFSNLSVFGAVDNITNKKYQIYNSGLYTMPNSTITLGVNYIFG